MTETVQFSGDLLKDLKTDDNNTIKPDDLDLVNFIFKKDKSSTPSTTLSTTLSSTPSTIDSTEYFSTSTGIKKRLLQSVSISLLSFMLYITSPTIKKYIPCIENKTWLLYICLIFVVFNISMLCVTFI